MFGLKIVDMHCDTISAIYADKQKGYDDGLVDGSFMVGKKGLEKSDYLVQNFALFIDQKTCNQSPFLAVKELLAVFQHEMEQNKDWISQVCTGKEIEENSKQGKISALLTVEEGGVCEGRIENLQFLYAQGVRMMTLTWNYPNALGFPNYNDRGDLYVPDTVHGLTKTGFEFVEEMQRLGMVIDVSHLSDAGFYDVCQHAKEPFVASHSNARAVCPAARNLSDDMIRHLAEHGGVMGLNFCVDFLRKQDLKPGVDARNPANWGIGTASIEDIVAHAKHIVNVGGIECIGLGSDFDGIPPHPQLSGARDMPILVEAFRKEGFHESEIEKICYKNVMRVYRDVFQ